ncbi:MAG: hypothetical protein AAFQ53_06570 [Bacteroidota bacterium]
MLLRYHAHDVGIVAELMRVQRIAGFEVAPDAPQTLVDLFLDTESFRLVEHGFALRLRQHDGAFFGRLRPLGAPLGQRGASHRQSLPGALPLPLALHDLAAGALRSALGALVGDAPLDLHARACIDRTPRGLTLEGRPVATIVLDEVRYEWARDFDIAREVKVHVGGALADVSRTAGALDAMLQAYGLVPIDPDRFSSVVERLSQAQTAPLLFTPRERRALQAIADGSSPVASRRARALMAFASRRSASAVAREVGMESERVRHWVERFRRNRMGLFEEGHASPTDLRPYTQAEIILDDAARPAGSLPATPPSEEAEERGGGAATKDREGVAPAREHRVVANAYPAGLLGPQAPVGTETEGRMVEGASEVRGGRGGVLRRVARVVTRRRARSTAQVASAQPTRTGARSEYGADEVLQAARTPDADIAKGRNGVREAGEPTGAAPSFERLADCIAFDFQDAHQAWREAHDRWGTSQDDASLTAELLGILDRIGGLVSCYAPYLNQAQTALSEAVAAKRMRYLRMRSYDVMLLLLPEFVPEHDDDDVHVLGGTRALIEMRKAAVKAALRPLSPPVYEHDRKETVPLDELLEAVAEPDGSASHSNETHLRHVLASMVWRQYERVVVSSEVEERRAISARRHALQGVVTALQHTFRAHDLPESPETRLLFQACTRLDTLEAVEAALAELDAWEEERGEPIGPGAVRQRLEIAREEERRASEHALALVLARPFRTYLGVIVAAS